MKLVSDCQMAKFPNRISSVHFLTDKLTNAKQNGSHGEQRCLEKLCLLQIYQLIEIWVEINRIATRNVNFSLSFKRYIYSHLSTRPLNDEGE